MCSAPGARHASSGWKTFPASWRAFIASWWPRESPMRTTIYYANGNEVELLKRAFGQRQPVMLIGPTGCGKTRLVEHVGALVGRPVATISCHDDLTSADLVGRFIVTGGDVVWKDGPLTRAMKAGAICY